MNIQTGAVAPFGRRITALELDSEQVSNLFPTKLANAQLACSWSQNMVLRRRNALVWVWSNLGCSPDKFRAWGKKMEVAWGKQSDVTSEVDLSRKNLHLKNNSLEDIYTDFYHNSATFRVVNSSGS